MNKIDKKENPNLVSNCLLCDAHGLHVMGEPGKFIMQCLNCGYTSTPNFFGTKETNEKFKALPEDIKEWAKETPERIWLPVQINLPVGMLAPSKIDGEMKWTFFELVDIPEIHQKDYVAEDGKHYTKRYETENPKIYETFLEAMSELNQRLKDEVENPNEELIDELTLPKLKRVDDDQSKKS